MQNICWFELLMRECVALLIFYIQLNEAFGAVCQEKYDFEDVTLVPSKLEWAFL